MLLKQKWRFLLNQVKIRDQGLYSPVALANYGIEYPVFNVGFGVERIAMILHDETDVRKISYHSFMRLWNIRMKSWLEWLKLKKNLRQWKVKELFMQ